MELMIPLKAQAGKPMYEQIYEYIKEEIRKGSLAAGTRLPSTRILAEHLKISRSTSQMAYDQLVSEGYIETIPCKGYFVLKIDELVEVEPETKMGFLVEPEQQEAELDVDFSPRGIDLTSFPYNADRVAPGGAGTAGGHPWISSLCQRCQLHSGSDHHRRGK